MVANLIVRRSKTVKLMDISGKQLQIEKKEVYHLVFLKHYFESGEHDEYYIENVEAHSVFTMENGRNLHLIGDNDVQYFYVVSVGE